MTELLEIESKITSLSQEDLSSFRNWFLDYDNQIWDKQFEVDVMSGKLDDLASKALLEFRNGKYSTL
jgi:hypothetical protein